MKNKVNNGFNQLNHWGKGNAAAKIVKLAGYEDYTFT